MGKIMIVGDLHCNNVLRQIMWKEVKKEIRKNGLDAIIVAGDFGWWPHVQHKKSDIRQFLNFFRTQKKIPVYWVEGNHENFDDLYSYPAENGMRRLGPALFHLPRGVVNEIAGAKVFSFGGGHSIDKAGRIEGSTWWSQEVPTYKEVAAGIDVLEREDVDIIVTHDVPYSVQRSILPRFAPEKADWAVVPKQMSSIMEVALTKGKKIYWFAGHYHEAFKHIFSDGASEVVFEVLKDHPLYGAIYDTNTKVVNSIKEVV